jgi:hypothetical protein
MNWTEYVDPVHVNIDGQPWTSRFCGDPDASTFKVEYWHGRRKEWRKLVNFTLLDEMRAVAKELGY